MMKSLQPRTVPVVDDAGGGRRGSRAVVSRQLWEVLVSRWAIPGSKAVTWAAALT